MKRVIAIILVSLQITLLSACGESNNLMLNTESKPASKITEQENEQVYQLLDFSNEQEGEFASRGLISSPYPLVIKDENGNTVWSQEIYDFARTGEKAPGSANPSLWRNTQYNAIYGLFKVTDDIYQVRGYDIANMTFVRTQNGWIIMDCMSSSATAKAALELFEAEMGKAKITAVIISHAHVDHYGGIEGVISKESLADPQLPLEEQIASGKTALIVPRALRTRL